MKPDPVTAAMRENLKLMQELLTEARSHAVEADMRLLEGKRNEAIGSMPGTDELLQKASALFIATRALHYYRRKS